MVMYNRPYRPYRSNYKKTAPVKTKNAAIKSIYKKARTYNKYPPTKPNTNQLAIATLSRQVKALQVSRLGLRQEERSHWHSDTPLTMFAPFAICAEWMHLINTPFQVAWNGNVPSTIAPAGSFQEKNFTINNSYANDQWYDCNDDAVSNEAFLPLYSKFQFEFEKSMVSADTDVWVRIDVVKPKKILLNSNTHKILMPDNMVTFAGLAEPSIHNRNAINPTFFTKVQKTRWIKLYNPDSLNIAKTIRKNVTINMKYPSKILKCDIEGTQNFIQNMAPQDLTWIVINSNVPHTDQGLHVSCMRHNIWRDQHGTTM